jgi:hypothetical protein
MSLLIQEKIRFPFQIVYTDEILDIGDKCRSGGDLEKFHVGLLRGAVPLSVITIRTGADKILPDILSSQPARDDMIHSKGFVGATAILASTPIPFQYVSPREEYPLAGAGDEEYQPHHTGKGIDQGYRVDEPAILFHYLRFTQEDEDDSSFGRAHPQGLIILVQDQDPSL